MELAEQFLTAIDLIKKSSEPEIAWPQVLAIVGESTNALLLNIDLRSDIDHIALQVEDILIQEPPVEQLSFLYCGIFDVGERGSANARVGSYLSGGYGQNPENQLDAGVLGYFPKNRFLSSACLQVISAAAIDDPKKKVFLYTLVFAVAALLAKHATAQAGITVPVYVGFDSGDFAKITS